MGLPLEAPMPPGMRLREGCTIRLECLDPTSGNPANWPTLSNVSFLVRNVGTGAIEELAFGPFMLVPGPGA